MNIWLKHPLRVTGRLIWLGAELMFAAMRYVPNCAFQRGQNLTSARARWLQTTTRRLLRIFRADVHVFGTIPSRGMLVSNHLGYVDILVFGSLAPAVFVSKHDVKSWPVFGWFSRLAGTIFVHRDRRIHAAQTTSEIEAVLASDALVIVFPEGTSSGGDTILPFKSSLLEPAARQRCPLTAGFIRYEMDEGDPREEVCYWKDMVLPRHMLNLLSKPAVRAFVSFSAVQPDSADRKSITRQLHAEVTRLKSASRRPSE